MYAKIIGMRFEPTLKNTTEFGRVNFRGTLSTYNLQIMDETPDTFTVCDNGQIVGDTTTRENYRKERVDLGFKTSSSGDPRDGYELVIKKDDKRIAGNWLKLAKYNGWTIRIIKEENGQLLLLTHSLELEKMGFAYFSTTVRGFKWVNKSDVQELE